MNERWRRINQVVLFILTRLFVGGKLKFSDQRSACALSTECTALKMARYRQKARLTIKRTKGCLSVLLCCETLVYCQQCGECGL
jgi:hypothetical protein